MGRVSYVARNILDLVKLGELYDGFFFCTYLFLTYSWLVWKRAYERRDMEAYNEIKRYHLWTRRSTQQPLIWGWG